MPPRVEGFLPPIPLRVFLRRYFFVSLRSSNDVCAAPPYTAREVIAPRTDAAYFVYVRQDAPPPSSPPTSTANVSSLEGEGVPLDMSTILHGCGSLAASHMRCQTPLWCAIFDAIGSAGAGFLLAFCSVAVQFDPDGGSLFLFGKRICCAVSDSDVGLHSLRKRQRCTTELDIPRIAWWRRAMTRKKNLCSDTVSSHVVNARSLQKVASPPLLAVTWLGRQNVSRMPLIADSMWTQRGSATWRTDDAGVLLRSCRPFGIDHEADDAACDVRGLTLALCEEGMSAALADEAIASLTVLVFPVLTSSCSSEALSRHLTHVTRCLICGLNTLLSRPPPRLASSVRVARTVDDAAVTLSQVAAVVYRECLSQLWFRPVFHGGNPKATSNNDENYSFWYTGPNDGRNGMTTAMEGNLVSWLSVGKRGHTPLHTFLHGVPVGDVPWLAGCCITGQGQTRRRGQFMQTAFLEVMWFLLRGPIPHLIRRYCHVTWSTKSWNTLLFFHRRLWRRLVASWTVTNPALCIARIQARDVGRMAFRSPLGLRLMYAAVKLLPDGCSDKLRPIATVRMGTGRGLALLAARSRRAKVVRAMRGSVAGPKKQHTCRNLAGRSLRRGGATSSVVATLNGSEATSPNRGVLRVAMQCLVHGLLSYRRHCGDPVNSSNRHHEGEYQHWRQFFASVSGSIERFRRTLQDGAPIAPLMLRVIRGDAAKCFDSIPQAYVAEWIGRLLPEASYHRYAFVAVVPAQCRNVRLMLRVWEAVIPALSAAEGCVDGIPKGWLLHEAAAPAGSPHAPACRIHQGSAPAQPDAVRNNENHPASLGVVTVDGDVIRRILLQHTQEHLVVYNKKLYMQHRGITQGSAVASLLCDVCLSHVDRDLADTMEQHSAGCDGPTMYLRRVDDIMVAMISVSGTAMQDVEEKLRKGWPEAGFVCHPKKLCVAEIPVCPVDKGQEIVIPWCGLLWRIRGSDDGGISMSLGCDWQRIAKPQMSSAPCRRSNRTARVQQPWRLIMRLRSDSDIARCAFRWLHQLRARMPLPVACQFLNSSQSLAITVAEACVLWSRWLVKKITCPDGACPSTWRFRHHTVLLLLHPARIAVNGMVRYLHRTHGMLSARGSTCALFCGCRPHTLSSSVATGRFRVEGRAGWHLSAVVQLIVWESLLSAFSAMHRWESRDSRWKRCLKHLLHVVHARRSDLQSHLNDLFSHTRVPMMTMCSCATLLEANQFHFHELVAEAVSRLL